MREAQAHLVLPILATAVAVITALQRPPVPSLDLRCAIWSQWANEDFCPLDLGEYTVFRQFPGPPIDTGANLISVQAYTLGKSPQLSIARSALIFNALLDDQTGADVATEGGAAGHDRYPRRNWLIGTGANQYLVDVFSLMEGGLIGVDERKRYETVFNFELGYRRV